MAHEIGLGAYDLMRIALICCFLACLAAGMYLHGRMMRRLSDSNQPLRFRYSMSNAMKTSEFYIVVLLLLVGGSLFFVLKALDAHSITELLPKTR